MHVVINAFSARRGGGKTYLRNILKHCPKDDNFKATLLISSTSRLEINHPKIQVCRVNFPVDNPVLRVVWETFILPFYLRKVNADVFFCPGGILPRFSFGKWKTVTMFRNMIPFDIIQRKKYPIGYMRLRNWLLSKSQLWSMEHADLVIFISEFAKGVILDISKRGINKDIVIPHGVSDDFIHTPSDAKLKSLHKNSYILYPSIIDVYKSQKEVVQAISILRNKNIDVPQLLMVGEIYGIYGKEVQEMIKEVNLSDDIKLTGPIPYKDMPSLYQNAKFIIFASQTENCPNILLESMASGKAVLSSNKMPMPEFGENAVEYFDPLNPEELAQKLEGLLKDPNMIEKMENSSCKHIKKYTWESSAHKTWSTLLNI
jgi:glycosyltransferase involved in cell wall biosynthesis